MMIISFLHKVLEEETQIACKNIQPHEHLGSNTSTHTSVSAVGAAAPDMAAVPPFVTYQHIATVYQLIAPH
jgi:hypothetical protein